MERLPEIALDELLGHVEYRVSERPHIVVDARKCQDCTLQTCITACPAGLFIRTADGGILFNYEQCFECGTCYMVCSTPGTIQWSYPDGGCGVVFHKG